MVHLDMTKARRQNLLDFLMDQLNLWLEGWEIRINVSPDLPTVAACTWEPARRLGRIEIWPTKKLRKDLGRTHEFYKYATAFTLLHELLHVRLEGHLTTEVASASPHRTAQFEWALDRVAAVILRGFLVDPTTASAITKG